jgi:PAS domain S-box-containing protein
MTPPRKISNEIRDRKRAEQDLAASEKKYRDIVENMSDVVFIADQTGKLLFITPSATRLLGYEQSEMIGHNIQEFIHKEDLNPALSKLERAVSKKEITSNEYRLVRKNGGMLWIQTSTRPLFEGDDVVAVQGSFRDITERKQVEEALKASEEKCRRLVKYAPTGIYEVDFVNRRLKSANDVMCKILGYTEAELLSMDPLDLLDDKGKRTFLDRIMKSLAGEKVEEKVEYKVIAKDGREIWTELNSAFIHEEGRITGALVVAYDITERKRVEEALRESEERHRSIFENSLDGIILSFPDGRIVAANPEACRMHGYTEAEICRLGRDGITDKSDPRLSKLLEDRSRTGRHLGEVTHVRRDGTKFPCETSSVLFKDKHGRQASVLIIRDITERTRAEEALREGERRAKRGSDLNRTMAELGKIIGSTLRIEEVYEQFAAAVKRIIPFDRIMIGLIDDQQQTWTVAYVSGIMVEGRQVGDVLPLTGFIWDVFQKKSGTLLHLKSEEELAERYPLLLPAFRAGTKSIMAAPLISKDQVIGTIQFSSLTPGAYTEGELILAGNVAGQISGAIANAQLFAKYERSEEALRRSRDELELRVQERTAELARKNEELQNFTFAASHDLQEPLRKIQTLSDFIATKYFDSVSEEGRNYLKRMHETATRMRDVLQSLLDYSRLTRTSHPFGRVDLNKIAREAVSDFEIQIRDTGGSVEIENLPEIEGDAAQMRQLFQNLIGNGLKFRREAIQPMVKIYACSSSEDEWEIYFSDNGIGFDEKYLDLIFKPFQRLHGKDEFGGNGMGLAICAKVLEHHKGSITARSVLGEGSTFIVTLPVAGTNAMSAPG